MRKAATDSHAVVIGAGIGGLTAAAALHQRGWQVTVLERAPSIEPLGSAISLAPNAQRALDVIGLGDEVRRLAAWQGDGGMRTPGGRWLSRTNAEAARRAFGGPVVLLHRAVLVERLAALLPAGCVHTGVPAELAEPGAAGRPAVVRTPEGELEAALVVGADGINSGVRRVLFPGHQEPVHAGFTTWRLIVPAPDRSFPAHESWGRGRLWGSQPLKDGRIYAYAAAAAPEGGRAPDDEKAELRRLFGDWHHPVPALIAAAEPRQVLRHDVRHLTVPLPAHHRGRAVLVGDAAHPMTPSLGQGGNQAIEDAIVLAHHAGSVQGPGAVPGPALAAHTADRLPRTTAIARRAAATGRLTMLRSLPAVALRNTLIAAVSRVGPTVVLRSFADIADWQPPQRTYAAQHSTST
ncbi:FAD-dependent oxidoreductase [Streptomyces sp. NBC_00344]|uniref:FAD-dependent oxidoreductase n=1 Tax=Streptomyces sp. NBC_00344 TaxID=2975720 RepID=UPI002E1C7CA9